VYEAIFHASVYGLELWVAQLDIEAAHDGVSAQLHYSSLVKAGFHPTHAAALLELSTASKLRLKVQSIAESDSLPRGIGLNQGDPEANLVFDNIAEDILSELVESWILRKLHFYLHQSGHDSTHARVADNIVLFARSFESLRTMLDELVFHINMAGLRVKPSSLTALRAGAHPPAMDKFSISTMQCEGLLSWSFVSSFELLGTAVDSSAKGRHSLDFRLSRADGYLWANLSTLRAVAPHCVILQAWGETGQSIASFGLSHVHATCDMIQALRTWENAWLRRLLRLRRKQMPDGIVEGIKSFNSINSRYISKFVTIQRSGHYTYAF
jgi:hypothetical protein